MRALRDGDVIGRARHDARALTAIVDRATPDVRALGDKLDRALTRLDGIGAQFGPAARERWAGGLAAARRAVASAERAAAGVRALADGVARGEGTLGGFLDDHELFDDLHEAHRLFKSQPWTFILKPIGPDKRRPAGPVAKPRRR